MSRTVDACPQCDSTQIFNRTNNPAGQTPGSEKRYHCKQCGSDFDEPVEREARGRGPGADAILAQHLPAGED